MPISCTHDFEVFMKQQTISMLDPMQLYNPQKLSYDIYRKNPPKYYFSLNIGHFEPISSLFKHFQFFKFL